MAGIIAVYSLVVSVLIAEEIRRPLPSQSSYSLFAYVLLTSGTLKNLLTQKGDSYILDVVSLSA